MLHTCVMQLVSHWSQPEGCSDAISYREIAMSNSRSISSNQYRLVFEVAHDPVPRDKFGGIDKERVTGTRIMVAIACR